MRTFDELNRLPVGEWTDNEIDNGIAECDKTPALQDAPIYMVLRLERIRRLQSKVLKAGLEKAQAQIKK